MAIDDAEGTDSPALEAGGSDPGDESDGVPVRVGEYTWADFLAEHGLDAARSELYESGRAGPPTRQDWNRVDVDPEEFLGFHPDELPDRLERAAANAIRYDEYFSDFLDPSTTPVVKDEYLWEHFKQEYYYDDDGRRPLDKQGTVESFDASDWLGFDPAAIEGVLSLAGNIADALGDVIDDRTVDVNPDLDEDAFFSMVDGQTTVTNRYDLEKAVPMEKKLHFREIDRYWVNKPYSFVTIFHSDKENETKYYLIEPYLNPIEKDLQEYLTGKLRDAIKYSDDDVVVHGSEDDRRAVIERETRRLLERYDLYEAERRSLLEQLTALFDRSSNETDPVLETETEPVASQGVMERLTASIPWIGGDTEQDDDAVEEEPLTEGIPDVDATPTRPEPILLEENKPTIDETQVIKLLYYLKRNFIGYERIDGIKHDINVEDISCDGYNSPVFVYHTDYEQIISNVYHGERRLDDFVVKLAQRSGKGISKRRPQVDATLPDGSRAQLTLGREVSDHGTNYTIRQFKDVPFTPLDLINWKTFSLEEMAFLWLCIENNKSLIFAGGTASGKTTSLNAVSLFIPSNAKIVSIEDTREVELPQRNWIASITRPSFTDDDKGDVDEFDLLEAALRQRPDYIVMGEIRGEEGRTLFQVMSTGHTTYTTFHADSVGEVLKRFTTDPINVSKTMFTALDLVSVQTSTRVQGNKVRRNKVLTEINHYDPENDEINVKDIYQWQAETDEFLKMGESNTLEEIKFDRGWNQETLEAEIFKRKVVLAYLIVNGLNEYRQVAATLQAFINDPETIMALIALDRLETSLEDLRTMESVLIDVDPEKEALVPRPDPTDEILALAKSILEHAEETIFEEYRNRETDPESISTVLATLTAEEDVTAKPGAGESLVSQGALEDTVVAGELPDGTEETPDPDEQPESPVPSESEPDKSQDDEPESEPTTEDVTEPIAADTTSDWVWEALGGDQSATSEKNGGVAEGTEPTSNPLEDITFGIESDDESEQETDSFDEFGEFESVEVTEAEDDTESSASTDGDSGRED